MSNSDSLFQLIKTLSVEEKRQFTKIAKINKKDAVYEALFKAMDKQQAYDEGEFKKKHINKAFVKNLSNRKNQLTDKLLDLLVGINSGETNEAKIKHTLTYLPVLFERKQFVLMRKKINSAKKIANEIEQFYLLLELIEWEKKMIWNDNQKKYKKNIEEIILEQEKVFKAFNEQFAFRNLRRRLSAINRRDVMFEKEENVQAFNQLAENRLLDNNQTFLSKETEMHYCYIKMTSLRIEQSYQDALTYSKRLLEICEGRKTDYPDDYELALYTYIISCDLTHSLEDYLIILEQIHENRCNELYLLDKINFHKLRYFLSKNQFDNALKIAKLVKNKWVELAPYLSESRYLSFSFNFMMLYWILGDLNQTQNWMICIRSYDKAKSRKDDIVLATRLFELVVSYELQERGEDIDFDKKIDTVRKTLKNNRQFQTFHQTVLQHCRELNRAISKKEKIEIIISLENDLQKIEKDQPKLLCLEEIILWCRSKIEGRSIRLLLEDSKPD